MVTWRERFFQASLLSVVALFSAADAWAQQSFATAQEAADALAAAADTEDPAAFTALLGADFMQEVRSGDPQADHLGIVQLGTLMRQKYELRPQGRTRSLIEIGADKRLFPLPLGLTTAGTWTFDVATGKKALLERRIQKNEERALKIVEFYSTAQKQYQSMTGAYASRFQSSRGAKDGLYWETGPDGIASPIAPLVERAENLGYQQHGNETPVLTGYIFRVLTAQGEYAPGKSKSYFDAAGNMTNGFGLVAYPARYGISGKMSFLVGTDGVVYQRDFGNRTEAAMTRIVRYDPDPTWHMIGGASARAPKKVKVTDTSYGIYPFYTETR